jgi:hypothetical protein
MCRHMHRVLHDEDHMCIGLCSYWHGLFTTLHLHHAVLRWMFPRHSDRVRCTWHVLS